MPNAAFESRSQQAASSGTQHAARADSTSPTWLRVGAYGAVLLMVFLTAGRLWWLPAHAPLSVNEGWNAGQALRAVAGDVLYPDPEALTANNYPPLSFYLVGLSGRLTGDMIVAGRIAALLAQIATGGAVWVIVRRLADRHWATIAALLFGGFSVTLLRKYLAIDDPQWLGQAVMSWALVLLVPRSADARPGDAAIVGAALMMVAGGLIKHNLVALPIAATWWLWTLDRRAFLVWIAAGTAFAAAACGLLLAIWGSTIFVDVLAPARSYSLARMTAKGGPLLIAVLPALIACRPLLASRGADRRTGVPLALLAVAVPIGVVQRAGSGVDLNAFFEAFFALSVAVPVACALRTRARHAWAAITALPALCSLPAATAHNVHELATRNAAVRQWQPFIARIAAAPGPVACDDQALCYWAGRESALDFFSIKQRLVKGRGQALAPALAEGRFAMIQMRGTNPGWQENLLIPAIRAHYRTVYNADGIELLVPVRR